MIVTRSKLMTIESLAASRYDLGRIVLSVGCFDILHTAHLEHLRQAKAMGDTLIVGVTADRHIRKGPGRPVNDERQRAEMLAALECVDYVFICDDATAILAINALCPAVYVKGSDYASRRDMTLDGERVCVEGNGGALAFTTGIERHSTDIIRHQGQAVSSEAQAFLSSFPHSAADVIGWLNRIIPLSVATVGESIVDEYIYVEPRGRSAKESVVTWKEIRREFYAGGISAVTNHLSGICAKAVCINYSSDAITKTRCVAEPFMTKVHSLVRADTVKALRPEWVKLPEGTDMIVVADYGHGLIDVAAANAIDDAAPFLALTVQANSLNWGMNTLTKWESASYIVLDEAEWRLAFQDATTPVRELLAKAHDKWGARYVVVTLGHRGCVVYDGSEYAEVPAVADKVLDRMGAGDAFLAATAPLAFVGAPAEVIGLAGNIAGALKVREVGNSYSLTRKDMERWVKSLLA